MKTNIVRIGNSRGIRIPKTLLEQCSLGETVELEVKRDRLVIRSARKPRSGWDEAFREMAQRGDDALLDWKAPMPADWDKTEWEW
jgi:antitoxin MazE